MNKNVFMKYVHCFLYDRFLLLCLAPEKPGHVYNYYLEEQPQYRVCAPSTFNTSSVYFSVNCDYLCVFHVKHFKSNGTTLFRPCACEQDEVDYHNRDFLWACMLLWLDDECNKTVAPLYNQREVYLLANYLKSKRNYKSFSHWSSLPGVVLAQ